MATMTHNDIKIGNKICVNKETLTVTDILDGYRGIGVTRFEDVHSANRWFIDISEIERKR